MQTPGWNTSSRPHGADDSRTILFIDNGHRDRRRERIAVLKDAGYKVHPARSFEQSISRIGSGSYHLVIANTDAAVEQALRFIEEVKHNYPRQLLLVLKPSHLEVPGDHEFSTAEPKSLLERVRAMLSPRERSNESAAA
ncbi:MAG TPA: hypothetical protein VG897_14755 [Terriglobales bacterium]|nr:hypothetical protein [Terriglobales bacterium]